MCNSKMCNWLKGLFGKKNCCEKKGCCEEKKTEEATVTPPVQEPTAQNETPATENQDEQKA